MKKLLIVMWLWLTVITAAAGNYETGAKAFETGNYPLAISEFEAMVNKGEGNAAVLYDLGTSYAAQGNFGAARLNLERAYRLDPGNSEIKGNLAYVTTKVDDANRTAMTGKRGSVEPDARGFIGDIHHAISAEFTSNYWAAFAVCAFILLLGSVALYLFPSNVAARKVGFFGGLIFLAFTIIFLIFSEMSARQSRNREYGIIMAYKYELLEEPDSKSRVASSPLTQGSKVRIISEEADIDGNVSWYKVRLNSGYIGWIAAKDIEVI